MIDVRRTLLRWFYRMRPPSLSSTYKTVRMLSPGSILVYYALYSDGCHTTGNYNGVSYFEGYGGPRHAPHLSFVPRDKPVYEWGISGLKYGDKLSEEQLNGLSST
jgi:hypothetical protein